MLNNEHVWVFEIKEIQYNNNENMFVEGRFNKNINLLICNLYVPTNAFTIFVSIIGYILASTTTRVMNKPSKEISSTIGDINDMSNVSLVVASATLQYAKIKM
jgi:hypothetical protein